MTPAGTIAIAGLLGAFGLFKLAVAGAALARLRAFRAGRPQAVDPRARHAAPWMFWGWVGWRLAAGALAVGVAGWLLAR